ncbi:hypothetical protein VTO42DRAFT_960 [Malbranchea cinnamomea]
MRSSQLLGILPCWLYTTSFILLLLGQSWAENAQSPLQAEDQAKRIAIIGAGSAGSSTAYYLQTYADFFSVPINITVFERANYIGGRSTTVNVFDDPTQPIELGASIFVEVNTNLMKAAKRHNLKFKGAGDDTPDEATDTLGIWDGSEFVFRQKNATFRWWNIVKVLWKYGWSPMRTQSLMKSTVEKFLKMYKWPYFPFKSLSEVAVSTGLVEAAWATGAEFLKENHISEQFSREIIQASTRVNYGQNLQLIHGLETMVCMATDGAVSIEGGNWQIFQGMLNTSRATLKLESPVTELHRNADNTYKITSKSGKDSEQAMFDHVVIAAPFQFSNITVLPPLQHPPDTIPYVDLHVTLFASPHKLAPQFFKLRPQDSVPEVVLSTLPKGLKLGAQRDGVGPAGFWSISTLRKARAPSGYPTTAPSKDHYVYKVFSPRRLTAEFLSKLLNVEMDTAGNGENLTIADMSASDIGWYHEKVWQSYPYLYPRITFEDIQLAPNLWYTSGIESFISTMETSSLAGKNVAALIMSNWIENFDLKLKLTDFTWLV